MANNGKETYPNEGVSTVTYGEKAWVSHPLFDMNAFHQGFSIGGVEVSYDLLAAELAPKGQTVEQFFHIPASQAGQVVELVPLSPYPEDADTLHPIAS